MPDPLLVGLREFAIDLPAATLAREELFLTELLRWNQRINLTAITEWHEALEKHLLDSLLLLKHIPTECRLLDMGSGGGLPGIPLSIALKDMLVASVDSVGKKINFQKHIKRLLALENLYPEHSRLENLSADRCFDVVTARALSDLSTLAEWAAPHQGEGGLLLIMKGPEGEKELKSYLQKTENHYRMAAVDHYQLPKSRADRLLISLIRK